MPGMRPAATIFWGNYFRATRLPRPPLQPLVVYAKAPPTPLKEGETLKIGPGGKRGVWRSVGGNPVFIEVEKGQSVPQAVKAAAGDKPTSTLADMAKHLGATEQQMQRMLDDTARIHRALSLKPVRTTFEEGMAPPKENTNGLCYMWAARFVNNSSRTDAVLVHGTVTPPLGPLEGRTMGHAWVEVGTSEIFDPVFQKFYNRQDYEDVFQAKVERRYTKDESLKSMLREKNYGPWHDTAGEYTKLRKRSRRR